MRRGTLVLAVVLAAGLLMPTAGAAGPVVQRAGPTVAEFVTMAANAGDAAEPVSTDAALDRLARLGVIVSDPDAPLSQEMLARIMGGLGHTAVTRDPASPADHTMAGVALGLVGSSPINPLRGIGTEALTPPLQPGGCLSGGADCVQCCLRMRIPLDGCLRFCSSVSVSPSSP